MSTDMINEYTTTDFWLASFLKTKGLRIYDVRRTGTRSLFVFEDRSDRVVLVKDFYNEGMVSVRDFKNAFQDLKSIIYNFKE